MPPERDRSSRSRIEGGLRPTASRTGLTKAKWRDVNHFRSSTRDPSIADRRHDPITGTRSQAAARCKVTITASIISTVDHGGFSREAKTRPRYFSSLRRRCPRGTASSNRQRGSTRHFACRREGPSDPSHSQGLPPQMHTSSSYPDSPAGQARATCPSLGRTTDCGVGESDPDAESDRVVRFSKNR